MLFFFSRKDDYLIKERKNFMASFFKFYRPLKSLFTHLGKIECFYAGQKELNLEYMMKGGFISTNPPLENDSNDLVELKLSSFNAMAKKNLSFCNILVGLLLFQILTMFTGLSLRTIITKNTIRMKRQWPISSHIQISY